jgi:hypothetical protein
VSVRTSAGVDLDLDRVVDLGIDEQAREAGMAAAGGIERALAHQPVHAGLGAQEAERVLALDLDRRAADAGDVAGGLLHHLGLEALSLAVLEVLAQQHRRPVARFGAAGAGLDVDEAVARVERVVEHAPELELGDGRLELGGVGLDADQAVDVAFLLRHLVQLAVVGEVRGEVVDRRDHRVERALLAAELLGALRLVPDVRVLEGGVDLVQAQRFAIVVKDTPGGRPCASSGRPGGCRWH